MNINLDNLSLNINLRIIFIKIINNSSNVCEDLFIRIFIKAIKNLVIQIIKVINNDLKSIKIIKKTLVSYYSFY